MDNDTIELTQAGMVAAFYGKLLGRMPTRHEAMDILMEEMRELEGAAGDESYATPVTDPEHTFKELLDVMFCLYGYALSRGWNAEDGFKELARSNMSKQPVKDGETTKIQKGENYIEPNLKGYMDA